MHRGSRPQHSGGGLHANHRTSVEGQQFCFPFWACDTEAGNLHCDPHCTSRGFQIGACMKNNHCCCYKPCEVVVKNY
ncbi:hypothetical protein AAVH_24086 [Aphelenchoides avenae]|nr:hypothetical protein AAVH_24086 [Aphelenchus avenae]